MLCKIYFYILVYQKYQILANYSFVTQIHLDKIKRLLLYGNEENNCSR